MAFPAAKLGALLLKQISKPIATWAKNYAKESPFFRTYVCMPPAQFYHWSEVKMKMWILNLGKPINIPSLNEQQAIELGASILGEAVIFSIAALIVVNEYAKSAEKEAKKERMLKAERDQLQQRMQELYLMTEQQAAQIRELMRQVYDLEGRVVQIPWKSSSLNKNKGDDSKGPPPASSSTSTEPNKNDNKEVNNKIKNNSKIEKPAIDLNVPVGGKSNITVIAYKVVENDLFPDEVERKPGIVSLALNHIYENVLYRTAAYV